MSFLHYIIHCPTVEELNKLNDHATEYLYTGFAVTSESFKHILCAIERLPSLYEIHMGGECTQYSHSKYTNKYADINTLTDDDCHALIDVCMKRPQLSCIEIYRTNIQSYVLSERLKDTLLVNIKLNGCIINEVCIDSDIISYKNKKQKEITIHEGDIISEHTLQHIQNLPYLYSIYVRTGITLKQFEEIIDIIRYKQLVRELYVYCENLSDEHAEHSATDTYLSVLIVNGHHINLINYHDRQFLINSRTKSAMKR